jgi:hypothetical protein
VTREEYRLRGRAYSYKRTGRCPTWYGAGVCTLELDVRAERRPLPRPWRRLQRGAAPPRGGEAEEWEERVRELVDGGESGTPE